MAKQVDFVRVTIRIPPELHHKLIKAAQLSASSVNSEIIHRLLTTFPKGKGLKAQTDTSNDDLGEYVELAWDFVEKAVQDLNDATEHLRNWQATRAAKSKKSKKR